MDLGISHYPPYEIRRSMHAFPDRAALLAYEEALQRAAALDTALEVCTACQEAAVLGPSEPA